MAEERRWYEMVGNVDLVLPASRVVQKVRDENGAVIHGEPPAAQKKYGFFKFSAGSRILLTDLQAQHTPFVENISPILRSQAWKLQFGALLEPKWGDHARFARKGDVQVQERLRQLAEAKGIIGKQAWAQGVLKENDIIEVAPAVLAAGGDGQLTETEGTAYEGTLAAARVEAAAADTATAPAAPAVPAGSEVEPGAPAGEETGAGPAGEGEGAGPEDGAPPEDAPSGMEVGDEAQRGGSRRRR